MHNCKQTEQKKSINLHAQDTTAHQHHVFLTGAHRLLATHISNCLNALYVTTAITKSYSWVTNSTLSSQQVEIFSFVLLSSTFLPHFFKIKCITCQPCQNFHLAFRLTSIIIRPQNNLVAPSITSRGGGGGGVCSRKTHNYIQYDSWYSCLCCPLILLLSYSNSWYAGGIHYSQQSAGMKQWSRTSISACTATSIQWWI